MKKFCYSLVLSFLLINSAVFSQEIVKVAAYNILNYSSTSDSRNEYLKLIMDEINADLIMVEEVVGQSGVNDFLSEVLNDKYKAGTYVESNDDERALFYKDSLFEFISNTAIRTDLRDINQFKVVHKFTQDTLYLYCVHLKAGDSSSDKSQRATEVNKLRAVTNQLPSDAYYLVAGDFNVYSSSESAYQALLDTTGGGYFIDPISTPGAWNNNSKYADVHTQSTRGGDSGGLDDRFDQILISESISQPGGIDYVEDSYYAFGNDGNHYNKAINDGTNSAVGSTLANALYTASDHLPVVASFDFGEVTGIDDEKEIPSGYKLSQNYPNPFNPSTNITYSLPTESYVSIKVYDLLGRMITEIVNSNKSAGSYNVTWNASNIPSGIYFYTMHAVSKKDGSSFTNTKKMILMK